MSKRHVVKLHFQLQVIAETDTVPHQVTFSGILAHRSAISGFDVPIDPRSRRASSLAPGPDTPTATPLRDARHGSETGRRFSWRATAAVLQTHARRFSSSSAADRPSERQSADVNREHVLYTALSQSQRMDSNESTALGYANVPLGKGAQHRQHNHKHSLGFENPVNLTPQSVISALHGSSARTTPSETGDYYSDNPAAQAQRHAHGDLQHPSHSPADFAAQFESAAQLAAAPQSLAAGRFWSSVPSDSRSQHRIRRTLSSVTRRSASSSSHQAPVHQCLPHCPYSQTSSRALSPSAGSLSWAARQKSFQRMVPHSGPSIAAFQQAAAANEAPLAEGQHRPAPLPSNELARQAALDALNVMQDPPAAALHDVAACAASAFQVPVVVITLIGDGTVWCQVSLTVMM